MSIDFEEPKDLLAEYFQIYDEVSAVEAELTRLKKQKERAKEAMIEYLRSSGLSSVGRDGRSLNHTQRSYPKVVDFAALVDYVEDLGEPLSEYMTEVFIKGSSRDKRGLWLMVRTAQEEHNSGGKPLSECLPPGLEVSTIDVLTVRGGSVKKEAKTGSLWDKLEEAIK